MSDDFDFENAKEGIQSWIVGYKNNYSDLWETVNLPGKLSPSTVEKILMELNQESEIVYARVVMGVTEKKRHYSKKGEFIGL